MTKNHELTRDALRHLRQVYHEWLMKQRDMRDNVRTIGDLDGVSPTFRDQYLPIQSKLDALWTSLPIDPKAPEEMTRFELLDEYERLQVKFDALHEYHARLDAAAVAAHERTELDDLVDDLVDRSSED